MARVNRREVLAEGDVQVVHCINRCVRRGKHQTGSIKQGHP